jgi:hypothetical protein
MTLQYRIFPESFVLHIVALEELATAEVASVPASPITAIPVINESAGWVDNSGRRYYQLRRAVGSALVRAGEGRMNTTPELEVFGVRNGDPGTEGREKLLEIQAGDLISVKRQRVPVPTASRIDGTDFLKLWSTEFDTSQPQTQYPTPQPNFGTDVSAIADPGTGVARIEFDAFQTDRESFAWSGGPPDILWNTADGTIAGGYADTDPVVEYDFPPGQHIMRLKVTDTGAGAPVSDPFSQGKRNVFVRGTGFTAFSDLVTFSAIVESHDITGRSMTFTVECDADVDLSDYLYVGADVFFAYTIQTKSAGVFGDLAGTVRSFKGYLAEFPEVYRDYRGIVRYQLRVENPLQYFMRLGINSQLLMATKAPTPPANWLEVYPTLANLAFVAYYLLEYNAASLLNVIDFIPGEFMNYFFPDFSFRGSSLTAALKSAASMRPYGNIGCLSDGAVIMRDHPWLMNSTYRTNLGTVRTWAAVEIKEKISYPRAPIPKFSRTKGGFLVQSGEITSAFVHEANLLAPGYGETPTEIPDFLATSQAEGSQIVGDAHAYLNRPTDILPIETTGMIDMFDLAEMKPHLGDVAAFDPLSLDMWGDKFLPTSVTRNWSLTTERNGQTIFDPRFTIAFNTEPETDGVDAPEFTEPVKGAKIPRCYTWEIPFGPDTKGWEVEAGAVQIGADGIKTMINSGFQRAWVKQTFTASTATLKRVAVTINALAGAADGTLVIGDATGDLFTQAIPAAGTGGLVTYTFNFPPQSFDTKLVIKLNPPQNSNVGDQSVITQVTVRWSEAMVLRAGSAC